ncbi:MAG TPA: histidine kinase, partial [Candidatus Obscuribacterales bacterium]
TYSEASLQLLLFVDERPSARKQIQQVRHCLESLKTDYPFELQVVDVGKQPYLAEHFKLVATPALIKIYPEPRHTLAGSNLVAQLQNWLPRWASSAEDYREHLGSAADSSPVATPKPEGMNSIASVAELIQLSDEVFRLKQEKEKLFEQLQFKDRIIDILAHDLRNPLTAASLALGTLELAQNANDERASHLKPELIWQLIKQARTQLRNMDRMIADILQAAKGTSGELRVQPQKLNLAVLCHDVLAEMQQRTQSKSQQMETDIPQDLPLVYADEERVRQVLVNLLDNAIKYTPEGGTIELTLLHRTTEKVQVIIGDNGPGIPEENRDRIFEDHFRLQRDVSKDGYGLGLSLCQRIVRAHYGRIWVESVPGKGSSFNFTLPVYRS